MDWCVSHELMKHTVQYFRDRNAKTAMPGMAEQTPLTEQTVWAFLTRPVCGSGPLVLTCIKFLVQFLLHLLLAAILSPKSHRT